MAEHSRYPQYRRYVKILRVLSEQKRSMTRVQVHAKAATYKQIASTTQALNLLDRLGYVRKREQKGVPRTDATYSIIGKGKEVLNLGDRLQMRHFVRQELIHDKGKKCCFCECMDNLTLFKGVFLCPAHLNNDAEITHSPRGMSMIALAQNM